MCGGVPSVSFPILLYFKKGNKLSYFVGLGRISFCHGVKDVSMLLLMIALYQSLKFWYCDNHYVGL